MIANSTIRRFFELAVYVHTRSFRKTIGAMSAISLILFAGFNGSAIFGQTSEANDKQELVFPGLLQKKALEAGNPLATYAAILELENEYRNSSIFEPIYDEVKLNFAQFLGIPDAGLEAMELPAFKLRESEPRAIPSNFENSSALEVIKRKSAETQIFIFGEEHHLPLTRSLFEPMLQILWDNGYRYLAAESFTDAVVQEHFRVPDYSSGFYLRDPIFANAVRKATNMGFKLVSYDTKQRGEKGDPSFRDRTQAENIKSIVFDRDPKSKVFIIAGRGHISETAIGDWTPMGSVLKKITGIDPFTVYAATMCERKSRKNEHPYYQWATQNELINKPVIFEDPKKHTLLGSEEFDAHIFWPRTTLRDGRPDWMFVLPRRISHPIPEAFKMGHTMRLIQAFRTTDIMKNIPVDQVVVFGLESDPKVLALPPGKYLLRAIDKDSRVLCKTEITVDER